MKPLRLYVVGEVLGVSSNTVRRRYDRGLLSGPRGDGGRGQRTVTIESLVSYCAEHGTPEQMERLDDLLDGAS